MNENLSIEISRFKFMRRQSLIDNLLFDEEILQAAKQWQEEQGLSHEEVMVDVLDYIKEVVPAFNAYFYFRIGSTLAKRFSQMLYRVRLGSIDEHGLANIPKEATVIFTLNHRSNMDYVLVSHFLSNKAALSYAVGEWAKIWPLQSLIRAMGAYFVRRHSSNMLYRKVLERYIQVATKQGVTQAIFLEGRLSRTGRLNSPRLGLLDYALRCYDPDKERPIYFVPVGINYDRTLEDRTLLMAGEVDHFQVKQHPLWGFLRFFGKQLSLVLRRRWHRFGYACVNFGPPLCLADFLKERKVNPTLLDKEERIKVVHELAEETMNRIAGILPILPVGLLSKVFLDDPDHALSLFELKSRIFELKKILDEKEVHIYVPRKDLDYSLEVGLRMLTLRRMVTEVEGLYQADPKEVKLLSYYANSIEHYFEGYRN